MSYRIRFHPAVTDDLNAITCWLIDYAGPQSAARRLDEIEATIASLTDLPQKGNCQDESAPELRAVPAGRKAVVAFTVDDEAREMHVHAVTYAGADWITRRKARGR
ncbi:type II toxin-antitoxin system RelE/ParE family toxin [Roseivivax sp.]